MKPNTDIRIEYSPRESIYVFRGEWIEDGGTTRCGRWISGKSTYSETREIAIKLFGNLKVTGNG